MQKNLLSKDLQISGILTQNLKKDLHSCLHHLQISEVKNRTCVFTGPINVNQINVFPTSTVSCLRKFLPSKGLLERNTVKSYHLSARDWGRNFVENLFSTFDGTNLWCLHALSWREKENIDEFIMKVVGLMERGTLNPLDWR